ncbi:MAG: ABC transporter ATP-binding protein [Gammaproteobacteria bacterium]
MSLLQFEAVQKSLGRRAVLRTLDLEVEEGEFLVVIGGSGTGKSTLLRLAAGLEQADAGRILIEGQCIDDPAGGRFTPPQRRRIGMVFQDFALWPHMCCLDNVAMALRGRRRDGRVESLALLKRLGIAELAQRRPGGISGGEQQRVGIARALASRPRVLLLDEPFSSLDVDTTEILRMELLQAVRETGMTTLLVSHDPVDAWRLADRIAVLEGGRLVQCAAPSVIYAAPRTPRIARFTGAEGGIKARVEQVNGVTGVRVESHFLPATAMNVAAGEPCEMYVRPEGVRVNGVDGLPCELAHSAFESGAYRAYWRVPGQARWLCSLETTPPLKQGALMLDAQHAFLYPVEDAK